MDNKTTSQEISLGEKDIPASALLEEMSQEVAFDKRDVPGHLSCVVLSKSETVKVTGIQTEFSENSLFPQQNCSTE